MPDAAPDTPRAVWLTHADISWLHTSTDTPQRREALMRLNIGFNSAPADPADAIRQALWDWWMDQDDDTGEAEDIDNARKAVLAALGYPTNTYPKD